MPDTKTPHATDGSAGPDPITLAAEVMEKYTRRKAQRQPHEGTWFVNAAMLRGQQHVEYDDIGARLVVPEQPSYSVTIDLNKIRPKHKARMAKYFKNRPKPIAVPASTDYKDLMDLTEEMLRTLAQNIVGTTTITYQGEQYDFSKPFTRITVKDSILRFNPQLTAADLETPEAARRAAVDLRIPLKDNYGLGKIQIEIFEKTVEHRLKDPTFITAYPTEVSPLARCNVDNPLLTDRFEFFVGGREIANGFSELNDPEDQAERFRRQVEEKEAGDEEAMHFDADYIRALEHGMPPTAGEGIGIDRLVMLFTDLPSIRDVLLFPHMRPES